MILPPLPEPYFEVLKAFSESQMQAYALLAIKTICGGKHPKKFSAEEVNLIRKLHAQGFNYKGVSRQIEMSERTFRNIVNKQGAYK